MKMCKYPRQNQKPPPQRLYKHSYKVTEDRGSWVSRRSWEKLLGRQQGGLAVGSPRASTQVGVQSGVLKVFNNNEEED